VRLPRQLDQVVFPDGDYFAEVLRGNGALLHHLAGLEPHLADRRLAVLAGAFVEDTVDELQSLREGLRIVRKRAHDLVGVQRHGARRLR
jgi:hypothetical protein